MAFFTRPELDDRQFKQPTGSTLTLSGTTNYVGTLKSKGVTIDASDNSASGDTGNTYVLKYDHVDRTIKLDFVTGGTSSESKLGNYGPTTVTVGGIPSGTGPAAVSAKTAIELWRQALYPTLNPTLTGPSNGFSSAINGVFREIGSTITTINFTASFNRGSINPQYTSASPFRAGLPNTYFYTGAALPGSVASTALSNPQSISNYVVAASNSWSSSVAYDAGVQPKDSSGGNFGSPLPAGTTGSQGVSFTGIYPVIWGRTSGARPTANQALINTYVGKIDTSVSTGTININFASSASDFLWFAVPTTSALKTVWFVNALNTGAIGGAVSPGGNLFPAPDTVVINSPNAYWSGVSYRIYISNYSTAQAANMELRNS